MAIAIEDRYLQACPSIVSAALGPMEVPVDTLSLWVRDDSRPSSDSIAAYILFDDVRAHLNAALRRLLAAADQWKSAEPSDIPDQQHQQAFHALTPPPVKAADLADLGTQTVNIFHLHAVRSEWAVLQLIPLIGPPHTYRLPLAILPLFAATLGPSDPL